MPADLIAIVGAPRTGKRALARQLAARIAQETGLDCVHLGGSCDPASDQTVDPWGAIDSAAASHDVVIADGTPLQAMVERTASLTEGPAAQGSRAKGLADALAVHRQVRLTLLMAFEGADATAAAIDDRLRQLMHDHGLPWSVVGGAAADRVERALDAVTAVLGGRAAPKAGLFTRLQQRQVEDDARSGAWVCARCDDPACEHASWRASRA